MIATLFLALAPALQEGIDERYVEILAAERAAGEADRPAILLRLPSELPRAAAGAWEVFDEAEDREAFLRDLDTELLATMGAAERAYLGSRFPSALESLYTVLERHPDFPPALMLLGTTYFRLRRYDDCRISIERFLEVAPSDLWRTQALGHAYYSLGDYPRARRHYERVLADTPEEMGESPEALRGLALCHMRLGDADRALELLGRVLELRPDHAEAYTFQARILFDEDRLEEALAAAERARELAPFQPQPWYFAMRILFDLGREEEALAAEARWREIDRVAQAVRALEMQLRFRPGSFPLILRLADLAASIGDVETVRVRLADAILARPEDVPEVDVRILVLDTLVSLGDVEGSRVAAAALEETCAGSVEAWRRLETYYASIRDRVNQIRCSAEAARLRSRGAGERDRTKE